uniref:Uncharacterized protein n=1 Tax=Arundo donax TaxID=35708 RepID=A0A0A9EVY2_ARUDO
MPWICVQMHSQDPIITPICISCSTLAMPCDQYRDLLPTKHTHPKQAAKQEKIISRK